MRLVGNVIVAVSSGNVTETLLWISMLGSIRMRMNLVVKVEDTSMSVLSIYL